MNDTTDPTQQLVNARFLRKELAGEGSGINPMNIKYTNPKAKMAKDEAGLFGKDPDTGFADAKDAYLIDLDNMISAAEEKQRQGEPFRLFPPVQAGTKEVLPNSTMLKPDENSGPSFKRQVQHLMSNVTDGFNTTMAQDKKVLENFIKKCG